LYQTRRPTEGRMATLHNAVYNNNNNKIFFFLSDTSSDRREGGYTAQHNVQ